MNVANWENQVTMFKSVTCKTESISSFLSFFKEIIFLALKKNWFHIAHLQMWNKCAEMIVIHYLFIFTFFPGCKAVDMQLIPADNLLDHVHFKQIHQWGTFWSLQVHQQSHSGYFGFHKTFTTDLSVDSFAVVSGADPAAADFLWDWIVIRLVLHSFNQR